MGNAADHLDHLTDQLHWRWGAVGLAQSDPSRGRLRTWAFGVQHVERRHADNRFRGGRDPDRGHIRSPRLVCVGRPLPRRRCRVQNGTGQTYAAAADRPSIGRTWRVNTELWSHPLRRNVYLALWVPNGLVVGCEALFVAYAPDSAGVLFMAGALGMLAGDTVTGRLLSPAWRTKLIAPMRLLLAAPYLLFAAALPMPIAVIAVAVASVGFSATLMLQERLLALVPAEVRGQALGLHSSGMLTMQAVGATLAGVIADLLSPRNAIVVMAIASLAVTIALTPRLRVRIEPPIAEKAATPA